ncbi:MAG TPA: AAA family ATPase [Thermoplasmata archaeon]|jgi:tetratricopeptide (TPR) repeat protein|nr:AAA family ATPase [Thermoplasmata archaeon]
MAGRPSRGASAAAPIIGRDEVLEEFDRLFLPPTAEGCRGCLVVGTRGSGKTVVLEAAVARARDRKFAVLRGHSLPEELPSPFSLIRDLLGSSTPGEPGGAGADGNVGAFTGFLAPAAPTALAGSSPGRAWSSQPTEPTDLERILSTLGSGGLVDGQSGREEVFGAVEEHFRVRVGKRPLLLAIDDLHFSDASSLEFLRRITLDRGASPTVVVATVGTGDEVPFRNRAPLEALTRSPSFRSISLRPLNLGETSQFVRWLYGGRDPNPRDVLRWHSQTEGNPLFIEQLVRMSLGPRSPASLGVPMAGRDVTEILLRLIETLPEADRNLLTFASVLGKEFRARDLGAIETGGPGDLPGRLEALAQEGLLRAKGDELYEFVTEALRASVYANLTETRRRILHRKAGVALEVRGGVDEGELARQFYLGRDDDRAISYNVVAAERAGRAFAFEDAFMHISRALESERRRPERDLRLEVRLLTEEGRILTEMGQLREAEGTLDEAVLLARSRPGQDAELGHALIVLAECRSRRGEYAEARERATEARRLLVTEGSPRDVIDVERILGNCFMREGDLREAEAHHRAGLEVAERSGTAYEQGRQLFQLASLLITSGPERFDQALGLLSRAAARFGAGEDYGTQARVLNNRALLEWTSVGRVDDARRDLTLATEAAERSRSRTVIGYCYVNFAQLEAEVGRPQAARPALERAARALAPLGDGYANQQLTMTRGILAQKERAWEEAEAEYREALSQARTLRQASETAEVSMRLAELAHDRGDDAGAGRWLAEARSSGLLQHRPDFAPRVAALEASLSGSPPATPS